MRLTQEDDRKKTLGYSNYQNETWRLEVLDLGIIEPNP
jgi:hypothetical protein